MKSAPKSLAAKEIHNPLAKVSLTDLVFFMKRMAMMLNSGLDIVEALRISHESASGKLKSVLGQISQSVTSGTALSAAFASHPKVFSPMVINSIRAGEQSGNLPESLETVAEQLNKERLLKSKIRDAMLYPAIVLIAATILGAVMAFFILPKITPLFESLRIDLPLSTRILIGVANLFSENGPIALIVIFGGIAGIIWLLRQPFTNTFTHKLILKIPAIGKMTFSANLARFSNNLDKILANNLKIDENNKITSHTVDN